MMSGAASPAVVSVRIPPAIVRLPPTKLALVPTPLVMRHLEKKERNRQYGIVEEVTCAVIPHSETSHS